MVILLVKGVQERHRIWLNFVALYFTHTSLISFLPQILLCMCVTQTWKTRSCLWPPSNFHPPEIIFFVRVSSLNLHLWNNLFYPSLPPLRRKHLINLVIVSYQWQLWLVKFIGHIYFLKDVVIVYSAWYTAFIPSDIC